MLLQVPDIVAQTIARHQMIGPGEAVLVAVSGGADSMALLHLLHRMGRAGAVAHFDHQTRGGASGEDAAFVAATAEALGLPCFTTSQPVASIAASGKTSFEMAARDLRYAFLRDTARRNGFSVVATGHHGDDQAETVLLRLIRGTGPAGLAGIPPVRDLDGIRVVRPLLDCTRDAVRAWLEAQCIPWREDASNSENRFDRNRVRGELMPLLARTFNPEIATALRRLSELQRLDQALLQQLETHALSTCTDAGGRLLRAPFRALHETLQYRCMLRCITQAGGQADYQTTARAVAAMREGAAGTRTDLGRGMLLYLAPAHAVIAPASRKTDPSHITVSIPGEARGFNTVFRARHLDQLPKTRLADYCHPRRQVFDGEALGPAFTIRCRRPGDRFRPLGMNGSRKLKEVLHDLHLTRPERAAQLLVESGGAIVWIPGHTIAADAAITARTRVFVELSLEPEDTPREHP